MDNPVELVKSRIDILSLVGEYVSLNKKGKNYWANCPFHGEKTPSFSVSPERGIFKCFGCGEGGDIFTFYQKIEGVSFGLALSTLAKKAGIKLENHEIDDQKDKLKDRLYLIHQKATEFYHYILTKHQAGKVGLEYLANRGIGIESIKEFNLGYAPNEWEALSKFLLSKGFSEQEIVSSGLSLPSGKGKKPYDRFRNRIVCPVFDNTGAVIAFSGRIIGQDEPKYLNSPDSPIFNKSYALYGLHQGKSEIKSKDLCILVEGNLDVVSSHKVGVKNVVAPLGTSLTTNQLQIIRRLTDKLAFCFDNDKAGINATHRGVELAEGFDFSIKSIPLASGKDPDDLIRSNKESWQEVVTNPVEIYEYYLHNLLKEFDPSSSDGKRRIASGFIPTLKKIKNPITKEFYKEKLASSLALEVDLINKMLGETKLQSAAQSTQKVVSSKLKPRRVLLEEYLLALIIQSGVYNPDLAEIEFVNDTNSQINSYLPKHASKTNKLNLESLSLDLDTGSKEALDKLGVFNVPDDVLESSERLNKEVEKTLREIKEISIKEKLAKLSIEIRQNEVAGNTEKLLELRKQFAIISSSLNKVETEVS